MKPPVSLAAGGSARTNPANDSNRPKDAAGALSVRTAGGTRQPVLRSSAGPRSLAPSHLVCVLVLAGIDRERSPNVIRRFCIVALWSVASVSGSLSVADAAGQGSAQVGDVIAAERAFASMSTEKGIKPAFLANLATDAIVFRPGPVPAQDWYRDHPAAAGTLEWAPDLAAIAVTGDLLRNDAYVFAHNGLLGYPVAKKINLPGNWAQLLADRR